jgi:hypothetical protein
LASQDYRGLSVLGGSGADSRRSGRILSLVDQAPSMDMSADVSVHLYLSIQENAHSVSLTRCRIVNHEALRKVMA